MIIRIQFARTNEGGTNVVDFPWAIFSCDEGSTLLQLFQRIKAGEISCGRKVDLTSYKEDHLRVSTISNKGIPAPDTLQPTPLTLQLSDIRETNTGLYIQFECEHREKNDFPTDTDDIEVQCIPSSSKSSSTIVDILMKKPNHYPEKKPTGKHNDVKQYNSIVQFLTDHKLGVRGGHLEDYKKLIEKFSALLWEIDPHYSAIRNRGKKFNTDVEKFLNYNNPKKSNHSVKPLKASSIQSKIETIYSFLDRSFLEANMQRLQRILENVCETLSDYISYLNLQRTRNKENREKSDDSEDDVDIVNYAVQKLKISSTSPSWESKLNNLCRVLNDTPCYEPVEITLHFKYSDRKALCKILKHIRENGLSIQNLYDYYFYKIPSTGPHMALNFIWKQPKGEEGKAEQMKIVTELRSKSKTFFTKKQRAHIKKSLSRLGVVKAHVAEYIMKELLGDDSVPANANSREIISRLTTFMTTGEDTIVDLREHNGAKGKYDRFWDLVEGVIEEKTAIDDRRHGVSENGNVIVNMAIASSYADLFRMCEEKAVAQQIDVPTYSWFLLQFWPTNRHQSKLLHHTGRFKIKKMVQARILRTQNIDIHYTNAIFSFLKKRAIQYREDTIFVSADAKCKVQIGEPGYPIAAVSRGKQVVVGANETFAVGDHDFSKLSLIPDAVLVHDIPDGVTSIEGESTKSIGKWYRGQVYYGVKDMVLEGSSAMRGTIEIAKVIQQQGPVPSRVFAYTDGGGDRRTNFLSVMKSIIALFLKLDLDDVIFARTAAGMSYRNPVERVHAIANMGLQSIGVMRSKMSEICEKKIKHVSSTEKIRGICSSDEKFKEELRMSVDKPKDLIKTVFQRLSLKEKTFKIYESATDDELNEWNEVLKEIDPEINDLKCKADVSKFPSFKEFLDTHCTSRTYFFQVFKCDDPRCRFHQPFRGDVSSIDSFPDPIPYVENDKERYKPGSDPEEKHIPSVLADVSKQPTGVPFSPTAQCAKNVGEIIQCKECEKPRLLYSSKKARLEQLTLLKRELQHIEYVCGSRLQDANENLVIYVRENLNCNSQIEVPYYSVQHYTAVCIYCGSKNKLLKPDKKVLPQCEFCEEKPRINNRKRKTVEVCDLSKKKKTV